MVLKAEIFFHWTPSPGRVVKQPTQVEDLFSRLKEAEESVAKAEGEMEPWDFCAEFPGSRKW